VATLALFIALGGVSYAVTSLPKNSVGNDQLKNGAVTSPKVKDHSLQSADLIKGLLARPAAYAGSLVTSPTPPASPGTAITTTITTTRKSKVFVIATIPGAEVTCSAAGSCFLTFALYVDGQPIDGSGAGLAAGASATDRRPLTTIGLTATSLPAGTHEVKLGDEASGNVSSYSAAAGKVGAIAVGG
jgi:hypothetical protein